MSTLPTLPVCGRPATIRVEAYGTLDGNPCGTLDASVYVCPDHAAQTVTVLEAAGFATRRLAGGTEVKRCGDGMDFTDPTEVRTLTAPVSGVPDTTSAEPPFKLPECTAPATVRLEVYSSAPGDLYGSLDASVYACDRHSIDTVTAVWVANLTAHKVGMAPDVQRTCGEVHIFPTGTLGGAR
ncbi:hypothetical protein [Verrucosispora sp. WMMD1129]|uniref:hypothetical protein n=1 Tax=Verrucosispora sp. WMMD1129 TaxID=3016093 RepID=UPI00249B3A91|nr:hypothetical protein [Verrucosispora sp. WMMD1129]WFE44258.1 hypothetical protein O7624_07880 [Verrucosispora sp. WMMD1129]